MFPVLKRILRSRSAIAAATVLAASVTTVSAAASPAQAADPDPVIIVSGTFGDANSAPVFYATLRQRLEADGLDVFVYGLPYGGLGDIRTTSASFAKFVDKVRAETGAERVDLIGHSQGGLVSRYFVKNLDGDAKVDSVIGLGAPHYGTSMPFYGCFLSLACYQMLPGSSFLRTLNGTDDTFGDADYSNFRSDGDTIVPGEKAIQRDGATNVKVQDQCPARQVSHTGLGSDAAIYSGVIDALRHEPISLDCSA